MKVINRKAKFDYELFEEIEAGLVLTGPEVKSVKLGRIKLDDAFVRIDSKGEVWLVNAHVHPYPFANNQNYQPTRSRKLLLHKKETLNLTKRSEAKNLTLIPTVCYIKKGRIKLKLALARGKRQWEKREKIKQRDLEREIQREWKR